MNTKCLRLISFLILFLISASSYSSELLELNQTENQDLQEIVNTSGDYFELFNRASGSCSKISLFSFERSRGLIKVARKAVYQTNTDYDHPRELDLHYLGTLHDAGQSFVQALEGLMGGRQQSFVLKYFEQLDDQEAINQYWVLRDSFQKQLGVLSRNSRVLVYNGHKKNSFGRSDLTVLLDPVLKELALFQAGWCE